MIIGVTSSIGSGKSALAKEFSRYGFHVINVDRLYKVISKPGSLIQKKIKKEFGEEAVRKNGTIRRKALKTIVFSDSKKLKRLNAITHPLILREVKKELRKNNKKNIILDAPLLIEAKFHPLCDYVVLVKTDRAVQMRRALKRGKHSRTEIRQIMESQLPFEKKVRHADFIIDNSGTIAEAGKGVRSIISHLSPLQKGI